jgi:dTDP-4-dehydrorhamnose 3,5-epimerase/CDP-3, 6-dideoxy-D-glycero-D-glycero-4-hexulose-5-epimerase
MQFSKELLPGAWFIELKRFDDMRGNFVKTYANALFEQHRLPFELKEEFYSLSNKDVIRGMHFQLPPHDHDKIVYCPIGAVDDVLLDLRAGASYGQVAQVRLSADQPAVVFIPKGIAHGFRSLVDGSLMVYKTSTEYAPAFDAGIRWDSFGFDWGVPQPCMSERDQKHPPFSSFNTPFPQP